VVGIDFGTTYSSASYRTRQSKDGIYFTDSELKHIRNWPNDPTNMGSEEQIPTESWYSKVPLKRPEAADQFDDYDSRPLQGNVDDAEKYEKGMMSDAKPARAGMMQEIDEESDEDIYNNNVDDDNSSEFLWGWSPRYQKHTGHSTRSTKRFVSLIKLLMLEPPESRHSQGSTTRDPSLIRIQMTVDYLVRRQLIRKFGKKCTPDVRDVRDVIGDFLTRMMGHIIRQLQIYEGLDEEWTVEIVLSVPVVSTATSSRILSLAMRDAVLANPWGSKRAAEHTASHIGLVTEPEAAFTALVPQTPAYLVSLALLT
jgi:hypothetical protein